MVSRILLFLDYFNNMHQLHDAALQQHISVLRIEISA